MPQAVLPILLFGACVVGLAVGLLVVANVFNPRRPNPVKRMPYESGMDPIHDTRRRFDVRFYLLAIAFLVFDVELLFLYPWAVASRPAALEGSAVAASGEQADAPRRGRTGPAEAAPVQRAGVVGIDAAVARGPAAGYVARREIVFGGAMGFLALLALGFVYDWKKGVFLWR